MVMRLPEGDRLSMSIARLKADLAVSMGGRVAEEMIFGAEKVTTGASSDISQATSLARRMITEFGMSDKLGPVRYNANEQEIFLGHSVAQQQNVSEATSQLIDTEVRRLIGWFDGKFNRDQFNQILAANRLTEDGLVARLRQEIPRGDVLQAITAGVVVPRPVIDALVHFYEADNANVHRGAHALSDRATAAYERARDIINDTRTDI